MPIDLSLNPIDELIEARKELVGQPFGRPRIVNGQTLGVTVQRAEIVLMSALLQSFLERVFLAASRRVLLIRNIDAYRDSYKGWGNPNPDNIKRLFLRLGIEDVLDGLSWRKCKNATVRQKLEHLNQLRNRVAHGETALRIDGNEIRLRQTEVTKYKNFLEQFGARFESHVRGKTPRRR